VYKKPKHIKESTTSKINISDTLILRDVYDCLRPGNDIPLVSADAESDSAIRITLSINAL